MNFMLSISQIRKALLLIVYIPTALLATTTKPKASARIIGGSDAVITSYPYLVSILYNGVHDCGGSIIAPKYILTAAHCVYRRQNSKVLVRSGSTDSTRGGLILKVERMLYNKSYNKSNFDNDVAIIKLANSTNTVTRIGLPAVNEKLPSSGIISGWGITNESSIQTSRFLKSATINIFQTDECKKMLSGFVFNQNMFCAGTKNGGVDSCQGDSGGPFVSNGKVFGIVSWGIGCGNAEWPGVYTNVPNYRNWIDNVMKNY